MPEDRVENRSPVPPGSKPDVARKAFAGIVFALMLVTLWSATHRYKGLSGDAELYAFQAMSRIHPGLTGDLFLQYGSQDNYTIFSPFYAWCIGWFGLKYAALTLAILFKLWLFAAAWGLARAVSNRRTAVVSVALLIIAVGPYGGFGVFRYAEDWLTARSLAEALAISAITLHVYGFRIFGLLVALLGVFVHPIVAVPGLLVLFCLWHSVRINLIAAAIGALTIFGLSLLSLHTTPSLPLLTVIDPEWLEVIRERSVFLFPHLWPADDWWSNIRPFLTLAVVASAVPGEQVRKLCLAALLVGATGLAVALFAGTVGPIAILVQGQAWRWMWITCFVSVLLLAPAASEILRDRRCGPIAAMLLISGWIFTPVDGNACIALALVLWLVRERIGARTAMYLRCAAIALGIIIASWTAFESWTLAFTPAANSGRDSLAVERIRDILGLQVSALVPTVLLAYWINRTRSLFVLTLTSLCLVASSAFIIPGAIKDVMRDGAPTEISEFAEWRKAIPPMTNVYVARAHNSATFAWFTLDRPSYLSVDQSAGVVFSRTAAMEVKRRSQVLLPLSDPNWRLLSGTSFEPASGNHSVHPPSRPLTKGNLVRICRDPLLGFVVAKENVGFDSLVHKAVGNWKNWHLYDCGHVLSAAPSTRNVYRTDSRYFARLSSGPMNFW